MLRWNIPAAEIFRVFVTHSINKKGQWSLQRVSRGVVWGCDPAVSFECAILNQRAAFELGPKESIAVTLSLTQEKPCHPHESGCEA